MDLNIVVPIYMLVKLLGTYPGEFAYRTLSRFAHKNETNAPPNIKESAWIRRQASTGVPAVV